MRGAFRRTETGPCGVEHAAAERVNHRRVLTVADAMRDAGAVAYLTKGGPCAEFLAVIRNPGYD